MLLRGDTHEVREVLAPCPAVIHITFGELLFQVLFDL
jgi:hypothetical protein